MLTAMLCVQANYIGTQAEDTAVDMEILRVQATDADTSMVNSFVTYSFDSSPDADFFYIDNMTGVISNAVILVSRYTGWSGS